MDNRGVGNSDTPKGMYSTSEMAKDVQELLDFVGWSLPKSVHIVGISMGGYAQKVRCRGNALLIRWDFRRTAW